MFGFFEINCLGFFLCVLSVVGGWRGWGPWTEIKWGPEGWGPQPRKSGGPKGGSQKWEPEGWGFEGWRAAWMGPLLKPQLSKISRFFSISRYSFHSFLFSWGSFRAILVVCLKRRGAQMCTFGSSLVVVCERRRPGLVGPPGFHSDSPRAQTCSFEGLGLQNTTKIQREDTQRGKKRTNFAAGEGKKERNFWAVQGKGGLGKGGSRGTEHDQTETVKPTPTPHSTQHTHTQIHTNTHKYTQLHTQTHTNTQHKSNSVWPNSVWPNSVWPKSAMTGLATPSYTFY